MMKLHRRFISVLMITVMICNLTVNTNASNDIEQRQFNTNNSISFIDSDGIENELVIIDNADGIKIIKHYIEGSLLNETTTTDDGDIYTICLKEYNTNNTGKAKISYSHVPKDDSVTIVTEDSGKGYTLKGTIKYKPYVTPYGTYNYKLKVYHSSAGSRQTTYTINKSAGTAVSLLISLLCANIGFFLAEWGVPLIEQLVFSVGGSISAGVITKAISKTVSAYEYTYNVKAVDPDTNRNRYYSGYKYRVAESTSGYSKYYYEDYYPYNSTTVAYLMYCDFWDGNSYPGVKSF